MSQKELLLVDDETRILRALKAIFRSEYKVHATTDCQEALHILRTKKINTIISDQRMPEMRGVDLLHKVKSISPNTMRLLLTGYSDIASTLDAINKGEVYRFVTKPWGVTEIRKVISEAMDISEKLYKENPTLVESLDVKEANDVTVKEGIKVNIHSDILVLDEQKTVIDLMNEMFSEQANIHYASSIENATKIFTKKPIQVVIVNIPIGKKEYLAFLKIIKKSYPSIVTVAVMSENNAEDIINLINEGQVYRYLPISMPVGRTRLSIQSAINYAAKINKNPVLARKHQVEIDTSTNIISDDNKSTIIKSMLLLKKRIFSWRAAS